MCLKILVLLRWGTAGGDHSQAGGAASSRRCSPTSTNLNLGKLIRMNGSPWASLCLDVFPTLYGMMSVPWDARVSPEQNQNTRERHGFADFWLVKCSLRLWVLPEGTRCSGRLGDGEVASLWMWELRVQSRMKRLSRCPWGASQSLFLSSPFPVLVKKTFNFWVLQYRNDV